MYINQFVCCGRLVADPEKGEHGGNPYVRFVVALNKPGTQRPCYINCIAWGDNGLRIEDHCARGTEVSLVGEIETSNFTDSRGSHHRNTTLKIEKFSVSKNGRRDRVNLEVRKPLLPPV